MADMEAEREKEITAILLAFVDFLYAVVFGLILAETYKEVIGARKMPFLNKAGSILLLIGVFNFLLWDWLHARLLTIKNPYRGYRRFFLEIVITCVSYGVALKAVHSRMSVLAYLALFVLSGALWAVWTKGEHPDSGDARELDVIKRIQVILGIFLLAIIYPCYLLFKRAVPPAVSIIIVAAGWVVILLYEANIPRPEGIMAGPGVPFLNRRSVDKIKAVVRKAVEILIEKKGG